MLSVFICFKFLYNLHVRSLVRTFCQSRHVSLFDSFFQSFAHNFFPFAQASFLLFCVHGFISLIKFNFSDSQQSTCIKLQKLETLRKLYQSLVGFLSVLDVSKTNSNQYEVQYANTDFSSIEHGISVNHIFRDLNMRSALHSAAEKGHVLAVHVLVQAGSQLDLQDGDLMTPIMLACLNGHTRVVQYLVKAGACVTHQVKKTLY